MKISQSVPYLLMNITQGSSQHSVSHGLASKRLSNNHEAVTHNHHLIDLKQKKKQS